jgi:hypothetical protein
VGTLVAKILVTNFTNTAMAKAFMRELTPRSSVDGQLCLARFDLDCFSVDRSFIGRENSLHRAEIVETVSTRLTADIASF